MHGPRDIRVVRPAQMQVEVTVGLHGGETMVNIKVYMIYTVIHLSIRGLKDMQCTTTSVDTRTLAVFNES